MAEELAAKEAKISEKDMVLEKFNSEKREEMKKKYDTIISEWLNSIDMADPKARDDFVQGVQGMVQKSQAESPVWKMLCCASEKHKTNVTELQRITEEYNSLKTKVEGGSFRSSDARVGEKRHEPEPSSSSMGGPSSSRGNYWDDFEASVRGGSLNNFTPDPERLKELRKDWTPL